MRVPSVGAAASPRLSPPPTRCGSRFVPGDDLRLPGGARRAGALRGEPLLAPRAPADDGRARVDVEPGLLVPDARGRAARPYRRVPARAQAIGPRSRRRHALPGEIESFPGGDQGYGRTSRRARECRHTSGRGDCGLPTPARHLPRRSDLRVPTSADGLFNATRRPASLPVNFPTRRSTLGGPSCFGGCCAPRQLTRVHRPGTFPLPPLRAKVASTSASRPPPVRGSRCASRAIDDRAGPATSRVQAAAGDATKRVLL